MYSRNLKAWINIADVHLQRVALAMEGGYLAAPTLGQSVFRFEV
jgi:hypothetical protein